MNLIVNRSQGSGAQHRTSAKSLRDRLPSFAARPRVIESIVVQVARFVHGGDVKNLTSGTSLLTFRTSFLDWALDQFPELADEFDGEPPNVRVHYAFTAFYHKTQAAIDNNNRDRVIDFFQMADRVLANAYPDMRSLFHVVFVEHLRFDDRRKHRSWALDVLTPRLRSEFITSLGCSPELRAKLA